MAVDNLGVHLGDSPNSCFRCVRLSKACIHIILEHYQLKLLVCRKLLQTPLNSIHA
jgi:hypothetical protein